MARDRMSGDKHHESGIEPQTSLEGTELQTPYEQPPSRIEFPQAATVQQPEDDRLFPVAAGASQTRKTQSKAGMQRRRPLVTTGIFAIVLIISLASQYRNRQLEFFGGMTDEWYVIGLNIAQYGTLGMGKRPMVFRPPGYPAFVGALVALFSPPEAAASGADGTALHRFIESGKRVVYIAQSVLLALSASLLFLWLERHTRWQVAAAGALVFGINPYMVILTGLLHYDILHIFLIVLSCLCLDLALERRTLPLFGLAGVLWGLTTLVRSLTLVLPLLVLALLVIRQRSQLRRALLSATVFTFALIAAIAPWTLRNYGVAATVIPVNAQGWQAIWASTVTPLPISPNHNAWYAVFPKLYSPVFQRATGREYSYSALVTKTSAVEREFKLDALSNLRKAPGTYLRNVLTNGLKVVLGFNSVLVKGFGYMQSPGQPQIDKRWFIPGAAQTFHSGMEAAFVSLFFYVLTALAALGVAVVLRQRDGTALAGLLVFACFGCTHALILMDLMYFYLKVPFVVFFAFYGLDAVGGFRFRIAGCGTTVAAAAGGMFVVACAVLAGVVLF